MYTRNNEYRRIARQGIKVAFLVATYLVFYIYTLPVYYSVKAYFEERLMTESKVIIIGESAVTVEVADTDDERLAGLSGREALHPGNGMFFIFKEVGLHGIWMKDMKFPIDILWFDQYGELTHFEEHVAPESFPETFYPISPSLYVLEVPAGFVQDKALKIGDKIDFY